MPNRTADILFQLVHSLQKSEKRNFKLYITRNSGNKDLKIVELFDALDKLPEYDEALLLKKPTITITKIDEHHLKLKANEFVIGLFVEFKGNSKIKFNQKTPTGQR